MELTLDINPEKCIRCGECVKICPSMILRQEEKKREGEGQGITELYCLWALRGCMPDRSRQTFGVSGREGTCFPL